MSTTTIQLAELLHPPAKDRKIRHQFLAHLGADARNTPRYLLRYSIIILAIFGILSILDAHGDGRIPVFLSLLPTSGINPNRASSLQCTVEGTTAKARWQGLAASLKILEEVNPEIARWIREKYTAGMIVFSDADFQSNDKCNALAKFDVLNGKLTINRQLFAEHDGNIAAILAHEFRHSRQNYPKLFRYALSFLFAKGGDSSIIENDAEIYEREAKNAIYGE
jgi:hypothetical protein